MTLAKRLDTLEDTFPSALTALSALVGSPLRRLELPDHTVESGKSAAALVLDSRLGVAGLKQPPEDRARA